MHMFIALLDSAHGFRHVLLLRSSAVSGLALALWQHTLLCWEVQRHIIMAHVKSCITNAQSAVVACLATQQLTVSCEAANHERNNLCHCIVHTLVHTACFTLLAAFNVVGTNMA